MWLPRPGMYEPDYRLPDGYLAAMRLGRAPIYDGWVSANPPPGMGDAAQGTAPGTTPSSSDSVTQWIASLAPIATSVVTGITQQKLLDYNLKLIAAGRPPLTADQLAALQSSAAPGVNVGLASGTQSLLQDALIGAAVIAGGFLLVSALSKGRRR